MILSFGQKGKDVKILQTFLNEYGFGDYIDVTTQFDKYTQNGVKIYQQQFCVKGEDGLYYQDGYGAKLGEWNTDYYKIWNYEYEEVESEDPTLIKKDVIKEGDKGALVKQVVKRLIDYNYLDDTHKELNEYTEDVTNAVKEMQKDFGFEETGQWEQKYFDVLKVANNNTAKQVEDTTTPLESASSLIVKVEDMAREIFAPTQVKDNNRPISNFTFQITMFDRQSSTLYDITQAIEKVSISQSLSNNAGQASIDIINDNYFPITEGNIIGIIVDGEYMFGGNIYRVDIKGKDRPKIQIKVLDAMFFMKQVARKQFVNKTCSQIFTEVCTENGIINEVLDESTFICPARNEMGKTLYEMVENAILKTLYETKKWYIMRANFGRMELLDITNKNNIVNVVLQEGNGLIDYDFETTIEDSYSGVKLYVKTGNDSAVYVEKDDKNYEAQWGKIVKSVEIDEALSQAQLQQYADRFLDYYTTPKRSLKLQCVGISKVKAGSLIPIKLNIKEITNNNQINGIAVVESVEHNITKDKYTMSINVDIVKDSVYKYKVG